MRHLVFIFITYLALDNSNLSVLAILCFVCKGRLFLIILHKDAQWSLCDFINSIVMCLVELLLEIWLSDGVYLNIVTEFI